MAIVTVTPTSLALEALSVSVKDADGVVATSTVDGWNIPMPAGGVAERLLLKFTAATNTDTVIVKAGANPPAKRANLGDLSCALSVNTDVKYVVIEGARHLQADGSINVVPGQTTTKITAFLLPTGGGGGL